MTNKQLGLVVRGFVLSAVIGLSGCAALLPDGITADADERPQLPEGSLGYEAKPTVALSGVVAGVVGTGVLVENHSAEHLNNVEIVINPTDPSGGFRFRTESVPPNATKTYMAQVFRTPTGESLNPMETKVDTMAVYADTDRGRGSWQGSYRDQF